MGYEPRREHEITCQFCKDDHIGCLQKGLDENSFTDESGSEELWVDMVEEDMSGEGERDLEDLCQTHNMDI